jgi:hypothetical protein
MEMQMNISGLDNVLKTLKSLPPEVVSKRGGVVRQSLATGMKAIQKEARKNLVRATSTSGKTGVSYGTGLTAKNVIYKRKKMPNGERGERLIMTVAYKRHPLFTTEYKKRPIKFNDIAFMLEYGTVKQQAEPWLRPAFLAKRQEAYDKVQTDLLKRIDKITNRLLRQPI